MKQKQQSAMLITLLCLIIVSSCGPSPESSATLTSIVATDTVTEWTATSTTTMTSTSLPTDTKMPTLTSIPEPSITPKPTYTREPSGWDRYLSRTMADIIEIITTENEFDTMEENELILEMNPDYHVPSKVQMIYSGEYREVSDPRNTMITIWLSTFAPQLTDNERKETFAIEALFTENGADYWIPVQKPLINNMKDELKAGDEVTLLIIWIGASKIQNEIDFVFLVNAFQ